MNGPICPNRASLASPFQRKNENRGPDFLTPALILVRLEHKAIKSKISKFEVIRSWSPIDGLVKQHIVGKLLPTMLHTKLYINSGLFNTNVKH